MSDELRKACERDWTSSIAVSVEAVKAVITTFTTAKKAKSKKDAKANAHSDVDLVGSLGGPLADVMLIDDDDSDLD
jgi:hypothetical protein